MAFDGQLRDNRAAAFDGTLVPPVAHGLAGTVAGAGALAGDLRRGRSVAGAIAGAGALAGALARATSLEGQVVGVGDATGSLVADRPLAGNLQGEGDASGTVIADRALAGDLAGVGLAGGALTVEIGLAGTLAGVAAFEGDLVVGRAPPAFIDSVVDVRGPANIVCVSTQEAVAYVRDQRGNMSFTMKEGDRRPTLTRQLTQNGDTPLDLSDATSVVLSMDNAQGTKREVAAVVTKPEEGWVEVRWPEGSTSPAGRYSCEFIVTFADGTQQTAPSSGYFDIPITPRV